MKTFIKLLLLVGVAVNCQSSSVLSRLALRRSKRDLTGDECLGQPTGALIPYPGDCTKYLVCQWNNGTVMDCPSGLHFSPTLTVCVWPTAAGCTQGTTSKPSPTPTPSPTTTTPTTIPTTLPTTTPPSDTSSESPTPTLGTDDEVCMGVANGTLSPYPYDCAWYIRCESDKPLVLPCEDGWLFNAILLICDYPENVDCTASPYPSPATTTTTTSPTTVPITSTVSNDSPTPTIGPDDEVCMGLANGTLSPYPYDCAWYIRCENDKPLVLPCEDGWLFNAILLICDYPENVDCTASPYPSPATTTTTTSPTTVPITTPSTLPTPATPTTVDPSTTTIKLPTPPTGSPSEPTTVVTAIPTLPSSDDGICLNEVNGAVLPYPWDCAWYVQCENQTPQLLPCDDGLVYNSILKICDFPANVVCVTTPYPTTASTPTMNTNTTLDWSSTTSGLSTEQPSTRPPYVGTGICENQELGTLLPYPSRCSLYIVCEETAPVAYNCGDGLEFNAELKVCQEPEKAGCSITTTTSTTTIATSTPVPEVPTGICEGMSIGSLIPYPGICSEYIRCQLPIPVAKECPDGLEFNADLHICEAAADAGCSVSYTTTPTAPETTPATPSTIPSTVATDAPTSELPTPTVGADDEVCMGVANGTLSPYPYDCAWYIRCESDKPLVLPCEDGWLFNAILLICDYPENVDCTASPYPSPATTTTTTSPTTVPITSTVSNDSPTPTIGPDDEVCMGLANGTLSPYPYDCAWYIRCENDKPLVLPCEDGWLFNAILLICDYPENVDCTASPYPSPATTTTPTSPTTVPITTPSTLPTPATPTTVDPSTTTIKLPTPPTGSPSEPTTVVTAIPTLPSSDDGICLNEVNGAVLPYPWDCAWYVQCENQTPQLLPCDDGLVYNSILKICDFPANVVCVTTPYPTTASTPTMNTNTTLDWSSTTSGLSTEQPSTRPPYVGTGICENQELGTLLPYPSRCSLYIVCEETAPVAYNCDNGLEFNAKLKVCQEPEKAGCSIVTTTTTTTTTEVTSTPAPEVPTGICEGMSIGDLIPYPGICSEYIRCQLPIPVAKECPENLEFNADLQVCETAEDAGCSIANITTTIAPETTPAPAPQPGFTGICRGQQEGDLIPYPGDCNKYIICQNPIPIAQKCGSGQDFNADLGICDDPDEGRCTSGNNSTTEAPPSTTPSPGTPGMMGICKGYQEGDLIPYPDKCNKYIRCETPVPIAQACQAGLYFNDALGICDTTESASCASSSTTENPSGSTAAGPTTTPSSTSTPSPTTTPKPPAMTGICSAQEIGDKIPYPKNCSKYIVCDIPVPVAIACQNGQHFNAELQVCDEPSAAGCEANDAGNVCCGQPLGTLLPYPNDCTQYIECAYPIPAALSCSDALHFNPTTKRCESAESAACEWRTTTEATVTTETPLTCSTAPDGTFLPIAGTCKKYYRCQGGDSITLPCPSNTVFSPDAGKCVSGTTCPP